MLMFIDMEHPSLLGQSPFSDAALEYLSTTIIHLEG